MNNLLTIKDQKVSHAKITTYPDGQQNVTVDLDYYDAKHPVDISASILNWSDLELLSCAINALRRNDRIIDNLYFVYLFGQRSDRAFESGQCNYFLNVLLPIIKSFKIRPSKIIFLWPHNVNLIYDLGFDIFTPEFSDICGTLIGGDESAGFMYHFNKKREADGNILKMSMTKDTQQRISNDPEESPLIVCDDLCDGGRTFELAGEFLKDTFPHKKLYLSIAHGIFSKGFDNLLMYYDKIYTTNSYKERESTDRIIIRKVI